MTDLTDPTTEQALAHVRENKDRSDQLHAWRANLLFFLRAFVGAAHGG